MWTNDKQSTIKIIKRICTSANSNNCLNFQGENLPFRNKTLPMHHDEQKTSCNPPWLKRKIKFCHEINWPWILTSITWTKAKTSAIQMIKRICKDAISNNCLRWWGDKFPSINVILCPENLQFTSRLSIQNSTQHKNPSCLFQLDSILKMCTQWCLHSSSSAAATYYFIFLSKRDGIYL